MELQALNVKFILHHALSIATSSLSAPVESTSSTIPSCLTYAFCKSPKIIPLIDFSFKISIKKKTHRKTSQHELLINKNKQYILSFPLSTAIKPP
jgi:hypothetical protein